MNYRQSHATDEEKHRLREMVQSKHNDLKFDHPFHKAIVQIYPTGAYVHTSKSKDGDIPHATVRYYHKNPDRKPESTGTLIATAHFNVKVCEFFFFFGLK
jgi:hypothetical protein